MYEFAALEYEKFLAEYPGAAGRDAAFFRLGESHRVEGRQQEARKAYERLAAEFQDGDFVGAAAYRLGELLFADNRFEEAQRQFATAVANANEPEVRLSARYQEARCLDRLGKPQEAAAFYREVAGAEGKNPYRDHARLALADALSSSGQREEALAAYELVANEATHPSMRGEAAVKAGAAAAAAGQTEKAEQLFARVDALGDANPWKTVAALGKLRLDAAKGRNEAVVALPEATLKRFKGDAKAEALALMGDANRQLGRHQRAAAAYSQLVTSFPESPFASRSQFPRIVALHEAGDASARKELETYLASQPEGTDAARARLLLAEMLFGEEKFAEAAPYYQQAAQSDLPPAMKTQAFYKAGWCLARTGQTEAAITAFTQFLEAHPEHELAGQATLQRGIARQQARQYPGALEDFEAVISKWPGAKERQAAMLQKALTLGQQDNRPAMKEAFLALLEAYPKSPAAAQAEYWIGWAAFEEKDYAGAAPRFARARELDPEGFAERAGLRLALCHYYLGERAALVTEIGKLPAGLLPREVIRWTGIRSAQEGDFPAAERLLEGSDPGDFDARVTLAEARLALGNPTGALTAAQEALAAAREPAPQARAWLAVAEAKRGLKDYAGATAAVEEALRLQPEGRLNAAGRMAAGEIDFARGEFDAAARAFLSVALLYDEPTITPRALERAADAYRRSNNDLEADKALEELRRRFPDYQTAALPQASATAQSRP
jgi:TolA-binding protein